MAASFRLIPLVSAAAAAFAVLAAALPPVRAQESGPSAVEIAAVLDTILAAPGEHAAINRFIGAGALPASQMASRARSLIRSLSDRRGAIEIPDYVGAVGRVATLASRALASTSVIQLAVSDDFRPENATVALDFGPPDGVVMAGFERAVPGDARIAGGSGGLRRPDDNALLSDGIMGVSRIDLDVGAGDYRVVLMTQNLADPRLANFPFGREVRVNGQATQIDRSSFDQWTSASFLGRRAERAASGAVNSGGYLTGAVPSRSAGLFRRQQGGAIIVEGRSAAGKLVVELVGFAGARTYLTGVLVEPLGEISEILLSEQARRTIVPLTERVELEALVLGAAAEAVQGLEPALGQTPLGDLVASQDR